MKVERRRSRIISFRLAEDEFEQLRAQAGESSVRSVSEVARMLVRQSLQAERQTPERVREIRLQMLTEHMDDLRREVSQLLGALEELRSETIPPQEAH
jgi:hypothetical protein